MSKEERDTSTMETVLRDLRSNPPVKHRDSARLLNSLERKRGPNMIYVSPGAVTDADVLAEADVIRVRQKMSRSHLSLPADQGELTFESTLSGEATPARISAATSGLSLQSAFSSRENLPPPLPSTPPPPLLKLGAPRGKSPSPPPPPIPPTPPPTLRPLSQEEYSSVESLVIPAKEERHVDILDYLDGKYTRREDIVIVESPTPAPDKESSPFSKVQKARRERNARKRGRNSSDPLGSMSIIKWSDQPKTVRSSIRPGTVDELKKIYARPGARRSKPTIIDSWTFQDPSHVTSSIDSSTKSLTESTGLSPTYGKKRQLTRSMSDGRCHSPYRTRQMQAALEPAVNGNKQEIDLEYMIENAHVFQEESGENLDEDEAVYVFGQEENLHDMNSEAQARADESEGNAIETLDMSFSQLYQPPRELANERDEPQRDRRRADTSSSSSDSESSVGSRNEYQINEPDQDSPRQLHDGCKGNASPSPDLNIEASFPLHEAGRQDSFEVRRPVAKTTTSDQDGGGSQGGAGVVEGSEGWKWRVDSSKTAFEVTEATTHASSPLPPTLLPPSPRPSHAGPQAKTRWMEEDSNRQPVGQAPREGGQDSDHVMGVAETATERGRASFYSARISTESAVRREDGEEDEANTGNISPPPASAAQLCLYKEASGHGSSAPPLDYSKEITPGDDVKSCKFGRLSSASVFSSGGGATSEELVSPEGADASARETTAAGGETQEQRAAATECTSVPNSTQSTPRIPTSRRFVRKTESLGRHIQRSSCPTGAKTAGGVDFCASAESLLAAFRANYGKNWDKAYSEGENVSTRTLRSENGVGWTSSVSKSSSSSSSSSSSDDDGGETRDAKDQDELRTTADGDAPVPPSTSEGILIDRELTSKTEKWVEKTSISVAVKPITTEEGKFNSQTDSVTHNLVSSESIPVDADADKRDSSSSSSNDSDAKDASPESRSTTVKENRRKRKGRRSRSSNSRASSRTSSSSDDAREGDADKSKSTSYSAKVHVSNTLLGRRGSVSSSEDHTDAPLKEGSVLIRRTEPTREPDSSQSGETYWIVRTRNSTNETPPQREGEQPEDKAFTPAEKTTPDEESKMAAVMSEYNSYDIHKTSHAQAQTKDSSSSSSSSSSSDTETGGAMNGHDLSQVYYVQGKKGQMYVVEDITDQQATTSSHTHASHAHLQFAPTTVNAHTTTTSNSSSPSHFSASASQSASSSASQRAGSSAVRTGAVNYGEAQNVLTALFGEVSPQPTAQSQALQPAGDVERRVVTGTAGDKREVTSTAELSVFSKTETLGKRGSGTTSADGQRGGESGGPRRAPVYSETVVSLVTTEHEKAAARPQAADRAITSSSSSSSSSASTLSNQEDAGVEGNAYVVRSLRPVYAVEAPTAVIPQAEVVNNAMAVQQLGAVDAMAFQNAYPLTQPLTVTTTTNTVRGERVDMLVEIPEATQPVPRSTAVSTLDGDVRRGRDEKDDVVTTVTTYRREETEPVLLFHPREALTSTLRRSVSTDSQYGSQTSKTTSGEPSPTGDPQGLYRVIRAHRSPSPPRDPRRVEVTSARRRSPSPVLTRRPRSPRASDVISGRPASEVYGGGYRTPGGETERDLWRVRGVSGSEASLDRDSRYTSTKTLTLSRPRPRSPESDKSYGILRSSHSDLLSRSPTPSRDADLFAPDRGRGRERVVSRAEINLRSRSESGKHRLELFFPESESVRVVPGSDGIPLYEKREVSPLRHPYGGVRTPFGEAHAHAVEDSRYKVMRVTETSPSRSSLVGASRRPRSPSPLDGGRYRVRTTASVDDSFSTRRSTLDSSPRGRSPSPERHRSVVRVNRASPARARTPSPSRLGETPTRFDSGFFDDHRGGGGKAQGHTTVIRLHGEPQRPASRRLDDDVEDEDSLYRVVKIKSQSESGARVAARLPSDGGGDARHAPRQRTRSISSDSEEEEEEEKRRRYVTRIQHGSSPTRSRQGDDVTDRLFVQRSLSPTRNDDVYGNDRNNNVISSNMTSPLQRSPSPLGSRRRQREATRSYAMDYSDRSVADMVPAPETDVKSYAVYSGTRPSRTLGYPESPEHRFTDRMFSVRSTSPTVSKGGRSTSMRSLSNHLPGDSGTGTEILSSDGEANGDNVTRATTTHHASNRIYEVRREPEVISLHESEGDGELHVERGKILIKNKLDSSKDEDEFDDNINVFDNTFHLQKDNPLYQSDPDLYRQKELDEEEEALEQAVFQKALTQDITFETVDRLAHTHRNREETSTALARPERRQQNLSQLLLQKLANVDSKDIHQSIHVEHQNEEIYGDIAFIHADGSRADSANTTNFDSVSENVDLTLREGKAFVIIRVIADRIIPIDYEFNVWRKSSAIVTRQIEIDLLANAQRRRLYDHVMERAGTRGALEAAGGHGSLHLVRDGVPETKLSSVETLRLFSEILNVAEDDGPEDYGRGSDAHDDFRRSRSITGPQQDLLY